MSIEYDPLKSYILSSTGMDYSIKFWDVRKPNTPVSGIYNNTHWIWNCKYNPTYSRVMITCSSSSIVRSIIFDKEKDVEDYNNTSTNFINNTFSFVDFVEFEDSVYSLDWSANDPWTFAAVSYNSYLHVNSIPEDIKYKIMLDN